LFFVEPVSSSITKGQANYSRGLSGEKLCGTDTVKLFTGTDLHSYMPMTLSKH